MILCMLSPRDENFDKFFQVRPILDHLKQKPFTLFWGLVIPYTTHFWFDRAGNSLFGFRVLKSFARLRSLAPGKRLKENWRGAHDEKECTISMRYHKCQVNFWIAKQKMFLEFSSAKKVLHYVKPTLIYSIANIFMVLEIRLDWSYVLRSGLG